MTSIPKHRILNLGNRELKPSADFVLYWMTANRRTKSNFALQRAVDWAVELKKPLFVLEPLRAGYAWASDRLHHFIVQGMADNAAHLAATPVLYYPYVEPTHGAGKGLLAALASRACVVVTDEFPCFFLPRMIAAASEQVPVRFELVDNCGLLPLRVTDRAYKRAVDFRRFLQRNLLPRLADFPAPTPLDRLPSNRTCKIPKEITDRWPLADPIALAADATYLEQLPIDHSVPVVPTPGGSAAAERALHEFVSRKLANYGEQRNRPEHDATSALSPYLHFGHIGAHQVFDEITDQQHWSPEKVADRSDGRAQEWWGISQPAEQFLDQLITWRELSFNMCHHRQDFAEFESLPKWAQSTLADHLNDPREHNYTLEQFARAETHDALWNAAQRQLIREGRIHNYLRMLWGKKIVEWTADPRVALQIMIELNNRYALDGRDPNSYSGIFWVLGRYDRAWGPERPIFGKVRWMNSKNTARKVNVKPYLVQYGQSSVDE